MGYKTGGNQQTWETLKLNVELSNREKDEKQWVEMQAEKEPSLLFVIELSECPLTVASEG